MRQHTTVALLAGSLAALPCCSADLDTDVDVAALSGPVPPPPSTNPSGSYPLVLLRYGLATAFQQQITAFNAKNQGTVTWLKNPNTCGYGCNLAPIPPAGGNDYAWSQATVGLHVSRYWGLVQRNLYWEVDLEAFCYEWQDTGTGQLDISIRPGIPSIEGGSWIEPLIDFFLDPGLSATINEDVLAALGHPGTTLLQLGACSSLGVVSGAPNNPNGDAFVWDVPIVGIPRR